MKAKQHWLAVLAAMISITTALAAAAAGPAPRPNIILAMADDMGWGDVGFNGNTVIKTPNLDRMASAGLRFTRFYSGAPECSPTRASCLTGRHPYRYGIWSANEGHMRREEITLAEALKTQGYITGHFGKWHLGSVSTGPDGRRGGLDENRDYSPPWDNGFDVCFSTEQAVPTWNPMVNQPFPTKYWTGAGQAATDDLEGDDSRVIMDRAVTFIRKATAAGTPFLAVIWFHAPHEPVVAGPEFRRLYADRDPGEQNYYGAITALDMQMGRLREELKSLQIAERTVLWFASDNGPEGDTGDRGTTRGSAGPFRGRKRSLWEGGVHVPGLLEWPGRIRPGTVTDVACSTLDYFPTTLALLGFTMPGQPEPIDGVNLLPLFDGKMKERPVPIPFETLGGTGSKASRGSPRMALVGNRYKLLTDMEGPKDQDLLFDLVNDRSETTNLAAAHPEIVGPMKQKLAEFRVSYERSLKGLDYSTPFAPTKWDVPPSDPAFIRQTPRSGGRGKVAAAGKGVKTAAGSEPAATPGAVVQQDEDSGTINLLARAAALHGGTVVYRAAQDKIGRWTNSSDWISWDFMVYQPGKFDLELTAGAAEAGNAIQISVDGQNVDVALPNTGGYNEQKTSVVGAMTIPTTGRHTLSVKPTAQKGQAVMTLWRLALIPQKP